MKIIAYSIMIVLVLIGGCAPQQDNFIKALREDVRGNDPTQRLRAISALEYLGPDKEVLSILEEVIQNDDSIARQKALQVIVSFGREAESVLDSLIKLLDDESSMIRFDAIMAISAVGAEDLIVDIIGSMLDDEDHLVRIGAITILGQIGEPPRKYTEKIRLIAETDPYIRERKESYSVRNAALKALESIKKDNDDEVSD